MRAEFDLHTHTRHSDGTTTPSENVALAARARLRGVALSDHDTLSGWAEAEDAARRHGIEFVPGVELSTELNGASVHLLGYWVDPDDPALVAECDRLFHERERRADAIIERLAALGQELDPELVRHFAAGAPIGRPHIAKAMVVAGLVADITEAFDVYLADGGPAYVPKHALAPADGVRLIVAAGGVPVLAHPALTGERDLPGSGVPAAPAHMIALVDELMAVGLAGIEADHAGHDEDQVRLWRRVAAERELLVTGSSDFHGENKDLLIGASSTTQQVVEELRRRTRDVRPMESNVTMTDPAIQEGQRW
jgi:3',5'-nucleoside bisphosphate phosphatase